MLASAGGVNAMRNGCLSLLAIGALGGCAGSGDSNDGDSSSAATSSAHTKQFAGEEPPAGYTRYMTAPMELEPSSSGLWAEWVSEPLDRDMDVVDIRGDQTVPGHHALMYSTAIAEDQGFRRTWQDFDQLSTRFLGGVGGEGGEGVLLPKGVVFRIPKGHSLMIQTHYINTDSEPAVGESYLDVLLTEASDDAEVASIFSNTSLAIEVEPGTETSSEFECELAAPLQLLMFANHMHESGKKALTEVIMPDASERELKRDDAWEYEWTTNPNYTRTSAEQPLELPAGTLLRTRCTWQNDSDQTLRFPDEMCVFFGFTYGQTDLNCVDGSWLPGTSD
jgi:hypothetical protein